MFLRRFWNDAFKETETLARILNAQLSTTSDIEEPENTPRSDTGSVILPPPIPISEPPSLKFCNISDNEEEKEKIKNLIIPIIPLKLTPKSPPSTTKKLENDAESARKKILSSVTFKEDLSLLFSEEVKKGTKII